MLVELRVRNLALVDDESIQFSKGMTAFTGETGAGKSLLLNAVTLLLGSKANKGIVRDGQECALVEGIFNIGKDNNKLNWLEENGFNFEGNDSNLLVVKRQISVTSKSKNRIWIQGSAATRLQLQELLGDWIEVSGQHEFLRLNQDDYLLDILDYFSKNSKLLTLYSIEYSKYKELERQIQILENNEAEKSSLLDLKQFQLEELYKQKITSSLDLEYNKLLSLQKKLKSIGKLVQARQNASNLIDADANSSSQTPGALQQLQQALGLLEEFIETDENVSKTYQILENTISPIMDAHAYLNDSESQADLNDPSQLEKTEERISNLNHLKRKFRCEINELYPLRVNLENEVEKLQNSEKEIALLHKEFLICKNTLAKSADALHKSRVQNSKKLQSLWQKGVQELGMPKAIFKLELEQSDSFLSKGNSLFKVMFSANPGSAPRLIKQVASGGELSRILLALKHISSKKSEVCAYLFDEIDTGIGGETAQTVGLRLREISQDSQVIVVTHLPQVAAMASDHFLISKNTSKKQTTTCISPLTNKKREQEIARMLGSSKSKAASSLAKELLKH